MGGASRNEKRRKQAAADARLRAAGITPTTSSGGGGVSRNTMIAVGAVLAVLVVGLGVWFTRDSGETVVPTYTATQAGGVVTAGSGPVVVDVYSDYNCSGCERFENRFGDELTTALNTGQVTVRYHSVTILDNQSEPAGYSTRAANAALCATDAGIFPGYKDRLYDEQPGRSGLTDEQLVAFGTDLGAGGDFAGCVTGGANTAAVTASTDAAEADPALRNDDGNFATPTVTVNGARIAVSDDAWLQNALAAG